MTQQIRNIDLFPLREAGAIAQINLALQARKSNVRAKDYFGEAGSIIVFTTRSAGRVAVSTQSNDKGGLTIREIFAISRDDADTLLSEGMTSDSLFQINPLIEQGIITLNSVHA